MNRFAAAAFAVFLTALPAVAQEIDPNTAILTVSGSGEVATTPDLVLITLGVTAQGKTAREALTANSTEMDKVVAAIRSGGVDDRDITTSNLSINPIYTRPRPNQTEPFVRRIVGYEVTNQVRLRLRDVAGVGQLLDGLVTAGANQVHGISFAVDEPQAMQDEATRLAVADARRKAELMAEAAGVRLVRILRLNTGFSGGRPVFEARAMAADAAMAPPVLAGEHTISANATITYEIAPR